MEVKIQCDIHLVYFNCECTIHVVHQKKFEFMLRIMMSILWQKIIFYYILYEFIYTSVACAVGPSVTTLTDFFFQNLVFWNLFEISVANIPHKLIPSTFCIYFLPNKFH
jgi:hypothetical protein